MNGINILFILYQKQIELSFDQSLASCLCKIIERMISNRLNWWLKYHNLLPDSQFGFRKQKSCIDNLSILYSEIVKGFLEGKAVSAAFLDIESAFDSSQRYLNI